MLYISNLISEIILNLFTNLGLDWFLEETAYLVALIIKTILVIVLIMMCVAYSTWLERKVHGLVSLRKGPNVVGIFGLLQPIYDGLKLFMKEMIIPRNASKFMYFLGPIVAFTLALLGWVVIPIEDKAVFANLDIGILYTLAISSLGVYGIMIAGWASNSKFSLYGAIRATAQMISYELTLGMMVICVILVTGTLNLTEIVYYQEGFWNIFKMFPVAVLFFITMIAETNRHPFDLPESEADIVSGYHTEYSGFAFALFFLAEYANLMLMASIFTILFLGGWYPILNFSIFAYIPGFIWFMFKVFILIAFVIQLKSILPRYRYDQLMRLGWKIFIPIALVMVVITAIIVRLISQN